MLSIKSEDGKLLEVDQSKFKDMKEVTEHAMKVFSISEESCLVSAPIHGTIGIIVSSFKALGKYFFKKLIDLCL